MPKQAIFVQERETGKREVLKNLFLWSDYVEFPIIFQVHYPFFQVSFPALKTLV